MAGEERREDVQAPINYERLFSLEREECDSLKYKQSLDESTCEQGLTCNLERERDHLHINNHFCPADAERWMGE